MKISPFTHIEVDNNKLIYIGGPSFTLLKMKF